ncbi:MAG TPA: DUF6249 domain-containing protein, partial [Paludibacteraceae bacterium]|nr:DUF6249 domain-containing protein [Paludibacteraceae bacterium]
MKKLVLLVFSLILFSGIGFAQNKSDESSHPSLPAALENLTQREKDSILLNKLSPEQLLELKKAELENERKKIEANAREDMPFTGFQLFLICVLPFLFVIILIWIIYAAKNKESKRKFELYMKALEMGQPIPEDFFPKDKKDKPNSNLKKGVLWAAVGLALLIYFIITHNNDGLIVGIVPTFVGIGY